jgi:2-methylisocitrate lyase-like PEP mutase family enzyme
MNQTQKAERFRDLHQGPGLLVLPNPWDAGSAKLLASMGFHALATTSAGLAFALGRPDSEGLITREETLANAAQIVDATDLPVSADLENGFGDSPEDAAETIRLAAGVGLVGGSIEDATGDQQRPIYEFGLAVERVAAGVEAARALDFPFTFVGRAENFSHGIDDLDDTIRRLVAFEKAGADVLFAPSLPSLEAIREVCAAVSKPVNVVAGFKGAVYSLAELEEVGVRRVSTGSSLARAALTGLGKAAEEVLREGTFGYSKGAITFSEVNALMRGKTS